MRAAELSDWEYVRYGKTGCFETPDPSGLRRGVLHRGYGIRRMPTTSNLDDSNEPQI